MNFRSRLHAMQLRHFPAPQAIKAFRTGAKLALLFLCLFLFVPMAAGFKPKWHRIITRQVFDDVNLAIGNTSLYFTAEAIEEIVVSNVETDGWSICGLLSGRLFRSQSDPSLHFDSESFDSSSQRLIDLRQAIIGELLRPAPDGKKARQLLGSSLHTVQDFYSHSNRAELNSQSVSVNPQLGVALFPTPSGLDPTCGTDGHTLSGRGLTDLTSGYFSLPTLCKMPPGKCRHGVPNLCPGINKDGESNTDRLIFSRAIALARDESTRFVQGILNDPRLAQNASARRVLVATH